MPSSKPPTNEQRKQLLNQALKGNLVYMSQQSTSQTPNKKKTWKNVRSNVANFLHLTPKNSARAMLAKAKNEQLISANSNITVNQLREKRKEIKTKKTKNAKGIQYVKALGILIKQPVTKPVTAIPITNSRQRNSTGVPVVPPESKKYMTNITRPGRIFRENELFGTKSVKATNGEVISYNYFDLVDKTDKTQGYTLKPEYEIKIVNGTPKIVDKTIYTTIDPIKTLIKAINMTSENIKTTLTDLNRPKSESESHKVIRENLLSEFVKQIPADKIESIDNTILQNIIFKLSDEQYKGLTDDQVQNIDIMNLVYLPENIINTILSKHLSNNQKKSLNRYNPEAFNLVYIEEGVN
jgi:hypothetical protein